ncbi:helix-turn-helix transcriptional regulator [Aquipuribacter nitratireducens]|uniref:Helix-turn-helix transcriptional regulator n=1 Tax=Aquipuribacter nitratireducens TaxID=650104 RepID=A0ABW0GSU4_9MICO
MDDVIEPAPPGAGGAGGRDQRGPMERLTQILFVLSRSPERTASTDRLLAHVGYGAAEPEDRRRQLTRDIGHLTRLGWEIRNVGASGENARYRLVAGDLRLRVQFSPEEQAELQRVARAADLSGLGEDLGPSGPADGPPAFVARRERVGDPEAAQRAVRRRCRLRFTYRGSERDVHPQQVSLRAGGWYLRAREDGASESKTFRLDRMLDVRLDRPGTADPRPAGAHLSIDPVTWQVDAPVDAFLRTAPEHVPHVRAMLGGADVVEAEPAVVGVGEEDLPVLVRVPVTHRTAFRGRLYELGSRVRLVGPDDLRDEVRDHLRAVVAGRP